MDAWLQTVMDWHIYLSLGLILCILEAFAPGFILFPIGVAFCLTAICAPLIDSTTIEILVLAGWSLIIFLLLNKTVLGRFHPIRTATNVTGMIGKEVRVIDDIDHEAGTGQVKLYADEFNAISDDKTIIKAGTTAIITNVVGNKVHVKKS